MPGRDYLSKTETSVASLESSGSTVTPSGVYYNPRLDPKNFLDGPLSLNPATRLRQMLARPGIVVRSSEFVKMVSCLFTSSLGCSRHL